MYAYTSAREGRELFIYVQVFSDGKGTGISTLEPAWINILKGVRVQTMT